jgi:hypothetical protein
VSSRWWSLDWPSIIHTLAVQRATIEKGRGTHVWTIQCCKTHAAFEKGNLKKIIACISSWSSIKCGALAN